MSVPKASAHPEAMTRPPRRLTGRGRLLIAAAVLVVIGATIWGVRGLLASPIESVASDGVSTLHGTWEPYACDRSACTGYLQAGARSVFVAFPAGCPPPQRAADLTVRARPDAGLGSGAYRALGCAG